MMQRGVRPLITWLVILSIAGCQSACPDRCLCYLSQVPRTVECSQQGLQTFPENVSDIVSSHLQKMLSINYLPIFCIENTMCYISKMYKICSTYRITKVK